MVSEKWKSVHSYTDAGQLVNAWRLFGVRTGLPSALLLDEPSVQMLSVPFAVRLPTQKLTYLPLRKSTAHLQNEQLAHRINPNSSSQYNHPFAHPLATHSPAHALNRTSLTARNS